MTLLLENVDLVAADGLDGKNLIVPIRQTCRHMQFRRILVFAPECPDELAEFGVEWIPQTWHRKEDYNKFMVYTLKDYVTDGFILNIHRDGYVLNWRAWEDLFLDYDYIGAPWDYEDGITVGNSGFALRSKKLLEIGSTLPLPGEKDSAYWSRCDDFIEDHFLFRYHGQKLLELGIKIAPPEVAARFSIEGNPKYGTVWNGQFGFHNDKITDISKAPLD
jgi:hypothetical protein